MDARCRIELFGALRVTQGDLVHTRFRSHKSASLLAYLALSLHQTHSRERLIELFWPDMEIEAGRDNLSTTLSQLRRQLEPTGIPAGSVLVADRQQVRLNTESVSTDVAEFDLLIKTLKRTSEPIDRIALLRHVTDLYRGELLPGNYADWAISAQNRCRTDYLECLGQLADALEASGDLSSALAVAQRMTEADLFEEEAYRAQMRLHLRLGRPAAGLEVYRGLEKLYRKELGALPSPEMRALAEQIKRDPRATLASGASASRLGARATAPAARAPLLTVVETAPASDLPPASPVPPLPLHLTRFFGRQREREELQRLLQIPQTRLVTLLGMGGVGKTRLSVAVAEQLKPAFAGHVWFVPLADVPDPGLIPFALLSALKLSPTAGADPLDLVVAALGTAPCLLLLDNFEHLLREAPELGKSDQWLSGSGPALVRTLLARVPGLVILVTSRQALRLAGEQEFLLSTLALPTAGTALTVSPESLLTNESIALYMDRARTVKPDFNLTANNAEAVARLCRMLEGVPLAIEMAAAWAKLLPPHKMLERLEQSLDLLVSRQRDLPSRHRSLRAVCEWSYDLLTPELRRLFACLSLFRGGWTLPAAEAVAGDDALFGLTELQSNSLIQVEPEETQRRIATAANETLPTEPRFRMYASLREFGLEMLEANGLRAEMARRHALWCVQLAEEAREHYRGPHEAAWIRVLGRERDNLRAALSWCRQHDAELGQQLAAALTRYWEFTGALREGTEFLDAMLTQQVSTTEIYARALHGAGTLHMMQTNYIQATAYHEKAYGLFADLKDPKGQADALHGLANTDFYEQRYTEARERYEQSLALYQAAGYERGIASTNHSLGNLEMRFGRLDAARAYMENAVAIRRKMGERLSVALTIGALSQLAHSQNRLEEALAYCYEILPIFQEVGIGWAVALCVSNVAAIVWKLGQPRRAATLYAAADTLRIAYKYPLPPAEQANYELQMQELRAEMDAADFEAARAEGAAFTLEQAVSYVLP